MENNNTIIINMLNYAKRSKEKKLREENLDKFIEEIKKGHIKENKLDLKIIKKSFFDDKIKIYIPESFKLMSKKNILQKYPNEARPSIIYTNKNDSVNICLNYINIEIDDSLTIEFRDTMKNSYINTIKNAEILDEDDFEINNKKIAYYSFNSDIIGGKIYNLVFNISLDNKPFICNFNCLEKERKKYEYLFYSIMKTIEIA